MNGLQRARDELAEFRTAVVRGDKGSHVTGVVALDEALRILDVHLAAGKRTEVMDDGEPPRQDVPLANLDREGRVAELQARYPHLAEKTIRELLGVR